ncbi:hypothetical protein IGI04_026502, partial [Brassica rapa subsp. trilocularis]
RFQIYSISSLYNYIIVAPSATSSVAIPSTFISAAASAFSDVVRNPLSAAAVVFSSTVRSSLSAGTTRSSRCFMPLFVLLHLDTPFTLYAFIQEGYGIVVQFLMFFSNEVYRHSIICLINVSVCLALSSFDVSSLGGVKLC